MTDAQLDARIAHFIAHKSDKYPDIFSHQPKNRFKKYGLKLDQGLKLVKG